MFFSQHVHGAVTVKMHPVVQWRVLWNYSWKLHCIDPSTHRPMDQSAWQHLWPLISAKVSWTAAICREARSSLWILSSSSDAKCVFGSMAKPFPSATHGNSYFKFSGLSRGKVDKLISTRHLQALECLLHSQHVFAHQFTSQGVQHFLWAWQSLSPSNIFKPCTRAYERCMRRNYGTLKNKNSRSKCTGQSMIMTCQLRDA